MLRLLQVVVAASDPDCGHRCKHRQNNLGAEQHEVVLWGARQVWRGPLPVVEGGIAWESSGKIRSSPGPKGENGSAPWSL